MDDNISKPAAAIGRNTTHAVSAQHPARSRTPTQQELYWLADLAPGSCELTGDAPVISVTCQPVEEEGEGIILARSSVEEENEHQGVASQVRRLADFTARYDLIPGELITAARVSGYAPLEDRMDLQNLLGGVETGWCRWVAAYRLDRIAQEPNVILHLCRRLRNAGVALWLLDCGRAIDWKDDWSELWLHMVMASLARQDFREAMVQGRWLRRDRQSSVAGATKRHPCESPAIAWPKASQVRTGRAQ
jgi:DNA invertase Pin-like site-specific DNA recombinase